MLYFRNHQLTDMYPVSEKAVRNWITSAREGKLDLVLQEEGGKYYIANTTKNQRTIRELVEKRKKFTNTRGHKVITPPKEFYKLYTKEQILDIITNIEIHKEVPFQYCYFNGGAHHWDQYAQRLESEESPNALNQTVELLKSNFSNIDRLLSMHKSVNIIDLGIGNAIPTRCLVEHLLEKKLLNKCIGLDLSEAMLDIAEKNIKEWFGNRVTFERYVRDIGQDRFRDVVVDNYLSEDVERPVNVILLLGGTLSNLREPNDALRVINKSMAPGDMLIFSRKLDTSNSRQHFDFGTDTNSQTPSPLTELMIRLLGFDSSLYDFVSAYDQGQNMRFMGIKLKVSLSLRFEFDDFRHTIDLNKDDTILFWRARHAKATETLEQFESNGFNTLEASQTNDHEYLLTISEIQTVSS